MRFFILLLLLSPKLCLGSNKLQEDTVFGESATQYSVVKPSISVESDYTYESQNTDCEARFAEMIMIQTMYIANTRILRALYTCLHPIAGDKVALAISHLIQDLIMNTEMKRRWGESYLKVSTKQHELVFHKISQCGWVELLSLLEDHYFWVGTDEYSTKRLHVAHVQVLLMAYVGCEYFRRIEKAALSPEELDYLKERRGRHPTLSYSQAVFGLKLITIIEKMVLKLYSSQVDLVKLKTACTQRLSAEGGGLQDLFEDAQAVIEELWGA